MMEEQEKSGFAGGQNYTEFQKALETETPDLKHYYIRNIIELLKDIRCLLIILVTGVAIITGVLVGWMLIG